MTCMLKSGCHLLNLVLKHILIVLPFLLLCEILENGSNSEDKDSKKDSSDLVKPKVNDHKNSCMLAQLPFCSY